jgi:hypothetical protein
MAFGSSRPVLWTQHREDTRGIEDEGDHLGVLEGLFEEAYGGYFGVCSNELGERLMGGCRGERRTDGIN